METERIIALISAIRDKANRFILNELKSRGISDIVPAHGGIIIHLLRNAELTMGEIAALIDRDKSTVTTLVNRLVTLGYLTLEQDTKDHRVKRVKLTKKGKALETPFSEISKDLLARVYAGLSEEQKQNIIKLLMCVDSNM